FHKSDVDVPATLIVDGVTYPNVGVHFRGMSSYTHVRPGLKRSLNLTMDFVDPKQRLHGVKTLNLLNAHEDGTFLSSVLYSHIARQYLPAPRANLIRVVINGENWGIYANLEQFNKEFLQENFKTTKGARWKVGGSPMAAAGLEYLGESVEDYKKKYTIKSKDDENAWKALVQLCKVLKETPSEKLEEALSPILDIDNALWFLALDNALINCDGYWIRASDYSLYQDIRGKFHLIPHDMNEAFRTPQGPGMGGPGGRGPRPGGGAGGPPEGFGPPPEDGPGFFGRMFGGGPPGMGRGNIGPIMLGRSLVGLDPFVGMKDERKPLRSKLLAVPKFREQYLKNVKTIAEKSLDWSKLGPVVATFRKLIEKEVADDTKKLSTFEEFQQLTADTVEPKQETRPGRRMHGMA
ncbi:MAG: CotH kinase family protein, partial [Gemmataceae bacterium]